MNTSLGHFTGAQAKAAKRDHRDHQGFRVGQGDAIAFGKNTKIYKIKGDTLYYMSILKAIIKSTDDNGSRLKLVSLDQKKEGIYRNVAESLL